MLLCIYNQVLSFYMLHGPINLNQSILLLNFDCSLLYIFEGGGGGGVRCYRMNKYNQICNSLKTFQGMGDLKVQTIMTMEIAISAFLHVNIIIYIYIYIYSEKLLFFRQILVLPVLFHVFFVYLNRLIQARWGATHLVIV